MEKYAYDFLKFFLNIEIVLIYHYQYDPKLFLQEQKKIFLNKKK